MSEEAVLDSSAWYVIQTKPRQEFRALEQLENQGFECLLPTLEVEKLLRGKLTTSAEPLFSRYLFVRLSDFNCNWSPIRSTRGVSKLLSFGGRYATLPDVCVEALRDPKNIGQRSLFLPGERVTIAGGPFAGLDAIYQLSDGEARALVLIDLMNQPQKLKLAVDMLRKAA
jgi:transcriptional antiterminator RfaH